MSGANAALDTITALTDPNDLRTLRTELNQHLAELLTAAHGENIVIGRRVRVTSDVTPLLLVNLTGDVVDGPNPKKSHRYVLLDESATKVLRGDHRAGKNRPPAATTRARIRVAVDCLVLADND
jgi:hypothetical protein